MTESYRADYETGELPEPYTYISQAEFQSRDALPSDDDIRFAKVAGIFFGLIGLTLVSVAIAFGWYH